MICRSCIEDADGALHDLHFDPSPAEALPQQTFPDSYELQANGETLALQHFAPAHTDSDIYVHFQKANVISMGDTFFNGMYPYIDPGTGGKITGMIAAADKILSLADNDTKIVAGHGPLGNKADLTKSRDMLITSRDRVQKLKSAGKSSVPLHRIIAVDLLHALSAERRASRSEYCSGSRCLGRWFRLERRLRHSCQGWLQRQHRPGAGDVLQRRCGGDEARPRSTRWTVHSCRSQLWGAVITEAGNGSIGCRIGLHRGPHAGCWRE
jgi:hypothetical protein